MRQGNFALVDSYSVLFFQNQFIENCQNLLAVDVHAVQRRPKIRFVPPGLRPFLKNWFWNVDVLPQRFRRVSTEEQTIENGSLPLWR